MQALPDPQTLDSLDRLQGFWIHAMADTTLVVAGSEQSETSIALYPGWNMVGFPASVPRDIETALGSITGKFGLVFEYDASDPGSPWKKHNPDAPSFVNTLSVLTPGRGYWIYATQACTWTVAY